jgi:imidazoleglycerol phosphate synthase glutamine amidotransferase subunit HisH
VHRETEVPADCRSTTPEFDYSPLYYQWAVVIAREAHHRGVGRYTEFHVQLRRKLSVQPRVEPLGWNECEYKRFMTVKSIIPHTHTHTYIHTYVRGRRAVRDLYSILKFTVS